jgi:hypothetical protein
LRASVARSAPTAAASASFAIANDRRGIHPADERASTGCLSSPSASTCRPGLQRRAWLPEAAS